MEFLGESVKAAARQAVEDLARDGGEGGVIAVDDQGQGKYCCDC